MKNLMLFIALFISVNMFAQSDSLPTNKGLIIKRSTPKTNYSQIMADQPLIILDGVALETPTEAAFKAEMNKIDPNTVEKIDVLKDEASKAIYGEKGANGVILITTKKKKKE
jgi:TonB-dependent SusC/RagA subfamily outer membrane receptor